MTLSSATAFDGLPNHRGARPRTGPGANSPIRPIRRMRVERLRKKVDAVVVGGGQAGVMLSHYLSLRGITHVVLERDRAFSAWHNRWDGFQTNTPNWMNTLPVLPADRFPSDDPLASRRVTRWSPISMSASQQSHPRCFPIPTSRGSRRLTAVSGGRDGRRCLQSQMRRPMQWSDVEAERPIGRCGDRRHGQTDPLE